MLKDLKIFVAAADQTELIWEMVGQAKVIASTAGPFSLYGSSIVAACVGQNTDYCDITGEIDWVRQMITSHGLKAARSGARLVFCSGADSVPWDLATFLLEKKLRANGEDMVQIEHFNEGKGKFSGGSLKTLLLKVDGKAPDTVKHEFDPLKGVYQEETDSFEPSLFNTKNKSSKCPSGKDKRVGKYPSFSLIGLGNGAVVKRSNALLGYNLDLVYKESSVSASYINTFNYFIGFMFFSTVLLLRPLRFVLLKLGVLPSPGEGPSEEFMSTNYLIIDSIATGSAGTMLSLRTSFNEDIAYIDTARILAESALCFVFQNNQCVQGGGVFTPASCFGKVLKKRLQQSGTEFVMNPLNLNQEQNAN